MKSHVLKGRRKKCLVFIHISSPSLRHHLIFFKLITLLSFYSLFRFRYQFLPPSSVPTSQPIIFFFLISYILPRRLNLTRKQHPAKISYPLCLVLKKLYRRPGLSASQTNPTSVFPCGVIFFPFLLAYFQYVCF